MGESSSVSIAHSNDRHLIAMGNDALVRFVAAFVVGKRGQMARCEWYLPGHSFQEADGFQCGAVQKAL